MHGPERLHSDGNPAPARKDVAGPCTETPGNPPQTPGTRPRDPIPPGSRGRGMFSYLASDHVPQSRDVNNSPARTVTRISFAAVANWLSSTVPSFRARSQ